MTPVPRFRLLADALTLALLILGAVTVTFAAPGPLRTVTVLAAACVVPGAALMTVARVSDPLLWLVLAFALSAALLVVVSTLLLWLHAFAPSAMAIVLVILSGALLGRDLLRAVRERRVRT